MLAAAERDGRVLQTTRARLPLLDPLRVLCGRVLEMYGQYSFRCSIQGAGIGAVRGEPVGPTARLVVFLRPHDDGHPQISRGPPLRRLCALSAMQASSSTANGGLVSRPVALGGGDRRVRGLVVRVVLSLLFLTLLDNRVSSLKAKT